MSLKQRLGAPWIAAPFGPTARCGARPSDCGRGWLSGSSYLRWVQGESAADEEHA
jgi:hypothetical protein